MGTSVARKCCQFHTFQGLPYSHAMSRLGNTRIRIYRTVATQLHGQVPCWVCGQHVAVEDATLEHIQPRSDGGSSHLDNLAISHARCNQQRHAAAVGAGS